jgi:hypothetical protein
MLPFSEQQFLDVFARYNAAIWPIQIIAYVFGVLAVLPLWSRSAAPARLAFWALAAMWAWTGLVYHLLFFAAINPAAWLFAALFVLEGVLLFAAVGRIRLASTSVLQATIGWGLIAYALVAYPLLGLAIGGSAEELPMFGVTPCPLVLFTLGVLLFAQPRSQLLWIVPLLWTLIGGSAAILLGVEQDWPLLASGLLVQLAASAPLKRGRRSMPPNSAGR